ncbi:MAG: preprotein translocase subunit YajC [Candidatus Omnitrophica bacterium ADurb.Bin292]|jgi:preprotein translocase subunit YajC|nr:MAG: preprotein translocase subunit YajC [Candidatus Omnitrophica bacterium ADurb.Bin292]HPW77228.1 preprotein translocase subunit YajC [Candidatus Omnitrophota bacterium]HQB11425.1 preprotein translocase subunit YajC [Candidatus Omnitrophota bacterium]
MFESIAHAAGETQTPQQVNPLVQFFPLIAIFFVFYFFLIRPQQQQQKKLREMVAGLKKGDKVITTGGILGEVSSIQPDYVVLNIGDSGAKLEVLKSAIAGLRQ